jgi:MFS family permease
MVKFGKKLLESQYSLWNEHYVDYKRLKKLLSKGSKKKQIKKNEGAIFNTSLSSATAKTTGTNIDVDVCSAGNTTENSNGNTDFGNDGNKGNTNANANANKNGASFQFSLLSSEEYDKTNVVVHNKDEEMNVSTDLGIDVVATVDTSVDTGIDIDIDIDTLFRKTLDREIEGVVLFFLKEQGEIASKLSTLSMTESQPQSFSNLDLQSTQNLITAYQNIGEDLLRLIHFVELNVMAVRKILKKHDKLFKYNKISSLYLSRSFMDDHDSHLNQLYHYGGISALVTSLKVAFYELGYHESFLLYQQEQQKQRQLQQQQQSLPMGEATEVATEDTATSIIVENDENSNNNKHMNWTNWGSNRRLQRFGSLKYNHHEYHHHEDQILIRINVARRHLHQSKEYVDILASQLMLLDRLDDDMVSEDSERTRAIKEEDDAKKETEKSTKQQISGMLNLASTLLYMTNYYIVAPTCGWYAVELGSSSAMAGIIIGMTPLAALLASILYAWWSNYSYKSALLFAAFCCILGDLLYALALHYHSLNMVILGRFLNGFGSARAINRRYIADSYSRRERTAASAAFVTAGALGMALGPAIAAMLGRLSYSGNIWTLHTSPGWIMCSFWVVFFISTLICFEDPDQNKKRMKKPYTPDKVDTTTFNNEKSALLQLNTKNHSNDNNEQLHSKPKDKPLWKNIPVMSTIWNYFVLKLVLECLLSSSAMLTSFYFSWDMTSSGTLLAVLGLLMFPANYVVAKMSHQYDEREMIMATLLLILLGIVGIIYYGDEYYTTAQYVFFAMCIFLGTNALEGPNMSLLTKTIPIAWARGTFNSGLLATEFGTLGRVIGDIFVSSVSFIGVDNYLMNGIFIPLLILVLITIALMRKFYSSLEPKDDDDDDDDDE